MADQAARPEDEPLPPHNTRAEQSVIDAVLKRPESIAGLTTLNPGDFYSQTYRTIWLAILDLWRRNQPIDYVTLSARLRAEDLAGAGVGLLQLSEINLAIPTAANVEVYADLVRDAASQRRMIDAVQRIAEKAWRSGADVDALWLEAEALLAAARPSQTRRDLLDPESWARAFWDDLEARGRGERTAVSTGLIDLDKITLGLEAGRLYLVVGTTGTGKSEIAMQVAMHVGVAHGPVVFASLEMTQVELAHRYARISAGMDRNRLAKGQLDERESEQALNVMDAMQRSRFWPSSPGGRYTTADLRADALEVQSRAGHVALIVADYVQRFRDRNGPTSSREENIGLVAENLKSLAREFGCPVLAPVQPNREYVNRPNKRPVLSDLRESGKLESEADMVLGLYRDEKHDDQTQDRGVCEVHVLKNRSGVGDAEGMRKLIWRGTRYDNYADPLGRVQAPPWAA